MFHLNNQDNIFQFRQKIGAKERAIAKKFFETIIPKKELAEKAVNYELEKTLHWPENVICQQLTKVTKFAPDIDKFAGEAKKIRDRFVTALTEAAKPDTKTTIPELVWYEE